MHICPQCAASIDLERFPAGRRSCPYCDASLPHDGERPWTDVARLTNLAEAGFLADELVGLGIDARIHQLEEFSALSDRWNSLYLIRVPASLARDAAARIRQYLAEDTAERQAEPASFCFTTHDQPMDPLLWRPVAIVILAGVASFVMGQRFSEQKDENVERRPPRNSLSSAVESIGRPLLTEPAAGRPRHQLSFDRRRDAWILDADRDGDGIYDSRQAFHASGAAW